MSGRHDQKRPRSASKNEGVRDAAPSWRHGFDRDRTAARRTLAEAAIVEAEDLEVPSPGFNLRFPTSARNSDALDEKHWGACADQIVMKIDVSSSQSGHIFANSFLQIPILRYRRVVSTTVNRACPGWAGVSAIRNAGECSVQAPTGPPPPSLPV